MSRSNWFSPRRAPSSRRTNLRRKPSAVSKRRKPKQLQLEALEERRVLSATVATDLTDYAPGATAQIIASEFAVGETVEFQVLHTDGVPNTGGGHEPWQVTDGVMGDFDGDGTMDGDLDGVADGNIHTTWYVNPDDSANSAFELTATGLSSSFAASHTFTDSVAVSGSGTVSSSSSSRTSATFSHTVGSGTDRMLLVTVLTDGDEDVSSVTYGGQALTRAIERDFGDDDGTAVEMWYLVAPPVGTANIVVTFASSVDPSYIRADNLTGVHQTSPIGATASAVGNDDDILVNITTTTANSLIFGAVAMHGGDTDPFSTGSGLTQHWDTATGSDSSSDIGVWGAFRTAATAQSYAFATEANTSDDYTVAVIEIRMSPETPSTNWATTLSVNTANDHHTTSAYNPSGSAGAETPPSQSYQADLYENWSSSVQNAAQTDIVTYQTAGDEHFYYFRFNQRGSVTGNESTVFHLEIDADFDDAGGDIRSDYFVQFNPSSSDVSSSWRNASQISEELFRDGNNNAGGSNLTAPDSGDPDGYSTSVSYGNNDVFGRIVGGAVEIAVRRSAINEGPTSDIRSRGWTKQDGNIDKSKLLFHDHNTASDLSSNRIDNTHGANTSTWLPTTPASTEQPAINIEKFVNGNDADSATGPILAAGGTATFTYSVTNAGNVVLSNISVVDDNGTPGVPGDNFSPTFTGGDTNSNGLLDLTETWTYSANRTVVANQYTNIATASGKSPANTTVTDTDSANYFGSAPALNIEKLINGQDADSTTGPMLSAGGTATFTYQVTNTGNIAVGSIAVVDDNGTPGNAADDFNPTFTGGDTNSNGRIDLGETWNYSATRTVVAGQYTNVGEVTGSIAATGQSVSDTDPANYFGAAPGVSIVKFVNEQDANAAPGPFIPFGSSIIFRYIVTNTGNVSLSITSVVDDKGTPADTGDDFSPDYFSGDTNNNGLLDVNEQWTYFAVQYAVSGPYTNIAHVVASDPANQVVADSDPANYFGAFPRISIEKLVNGEDADSATGPILAAGSTAIFTYIVTNPGNLALSNVVVIDDNGTPGDSGDDFNPTFTHGDGNLNGILDLDETWTYTADRTVVANQYTNIASARGLAASGQEPFDSDPANYFGAAPGINLVKKINGVDANSPTGPILAVGSTASFTYEVTNTGNIALGSVAVVDDNGTPGNTADDFNPTYASGDTNGNSLLDLGETWTYSANRTVVAGQYTNIGMVTGSVAATGQSVNDADPANYFGAAPSINVTKNINELAADTPATGPLLIPGSALVFHYVVTNTGNIALGNVVVVDDNGTPGNAADDFNATYFGGDDNYNDLLDLGETWYYSSPVLAVVAGQYTNIAQATGTVAATGQSASDTDPANYFGALPSIELKKLVNGSDANSATGPILATGGTASFTYQIANTGNIALSNVEVIDDNGTPGNTDDDFSPTFTGGDSNNNGLLDLDEIWSFSASAPVIAGQYTNIGSVHGLVAATNQSATDTDPANYFGAAPTIEIEKLVNGVDSIPTLSVGGTVLFNYTVRNSGNIALTSVAVVDDNGTPGNLGDDFNPTFTGGDVNNNGLLDLSEIWTYIGSSIVLAGPYTNTAQAAGKVEATGQSATDSDTSGYFGAVTGINLEKHVDGDDADSAPGPTLHVGDNVTFTYTVTNTGNIALANVAVVDDNGTPGDSGDDFSASFTGGDANGNGLLDLSETWTFTATQTVVAGQYTNVGRATGVVTATGQSAADSDMANYFGKVDPIIVIAPDKGNTSKPIVKVINPETGKIVSQFYAYEGKFLGGVQVATGDMTGDDIDEIIVAPGQGRVGEVRVFTQQGVELTQFRVQPYGSKYVGGVEVAVGDVNGDGLNDIVTATKYGRPDVRVFYNYFNSSYPSADAIADLPSKQFYVYASKFSGGADVIVADMGTFYNGVTYNAYTPDGKAEIIVGNGPGMVSTIYVYDVSAAPKIVDTILPLSSKFKGGITLSAARVNGDAIPDLIVAAGNTGGSAVEIWSGLTNDAYDVRLAAFSAFGDQATKNMPVHATAFDSNGDGIADVLAVVQGTNGKSNQIRYFNTSGGLQGIQSGFTGPWNIASLANVDPSLPLNTKYDVAAKDDVYTLIGATTTATKPAKKVAKKK